jgi:PAS domain S-box-containing protein
MADFGKQITLMSETDSKGIITFANEEFCNISRYSKKELLGNPHSIIRHPDMPKELFHTMWNIIKRGDIFRGIVKNKTKDGSHYWVQALIKPVQIANSADIKYVGIRHLIDDDLMAAQLFNDQASRLGLPLLRS